MKENFKIAILTCWYGEYPWYFPYFVHSVKFNSQNDFIIITDNTETIINKPNNLKIVNKTIDEIKLNASKKLGFKIEIGQPYKLCDFKPAYGLIFDELLKGYDFWGIGDIDVIYGNIRNFITDELLNTYDIISARHDFLVGYFTLYRNCKKMNELFMQSKDYKKVFASNEHFCFDECNFAFWKMDDRICFEDVADQCEIESMTHVVKKMQRKKSINAYFNVHAIEGLNGKIKWNKGVLSYKNEYEILLYHLIKLKKIYSRTAPDKIPEIFRVSPTRIY